MADGKAPPEAAADDAAAGGGGDGAAPAAAASKPRPPPPSSSTGSALTVSAPTSDIPSVTVEKASGEDEPAYTAEELKDLKDAPLSKRWPEFLDEDFKNSRGLWDPDQWHQNRRRGVSPDPPPEGRPARGDTKPPPGGPDGKVRH